MFEDVAYGEVLLSGELDEETNSIIDFSAAEEVSIAKIERVEPRGLLTGLLLCKTEDGSQAAIGDTAFLIGVFEDQSECLFTQDGLSVVCGEYESGANKNLKVKGASTTPVSAATIFTHTQKPSSGPLANLPVLPIKLWLSEVDDYRFDAQYQPRQTDGTWRLYNDQGSAIITSDYKGDVYIPEILQ